MNHRPLLVAKLTAARREEQGQIIFSVDQSRVDCVVLKLARCHVAFELNEPRIDPPKHLSVEPLASMTEAKRDAFESGGDDLAVWPEVGSRAMQRVIIAGTDVFSEGWLDVQPGRYRFCVSQEDGLCVRIVIREYLACEVRWD